MLVRLGNARGPIAILCAVILPVLTSIAEPEGGFVRMGFNNDAIHPYLKVGLWAWPAAMDYDGDGKLDLVVSCGDVPYGGTHFFRNPGQGPMPVFRKSARVAEGFNNVARGTSFGDGRDDLCVPGANIIGFPEHGYTKQAKFPGLKENVHPHEVRGNVWRKVDFDGDGLQDLLIGVDDWHLVSKALWWGGEVENYTAGGVWKGPVPEGFVYYAHCLRGEGETAVFESPERLKLEDGTEMRTEGNPMPMCADWDGDGDLDIICGEFVDGFSYFENVGSRSVPRYKAGRPLCTSGGNALRMDLAMITPSAVDWDGDGILDIICGDEDGRVAFVRNTGRLSDGAPVFDPPMYFRQEADALNFGCLSTPCGVDWDGDGDWDIVTGSSAGYIAFIENLSGPGVTAPKWAEPRLLKADGEVIRITAGGNGSIQGPFERKWGYTCLSAADWDGDGLPDLMVNSIWGDVIWFRNVGTRTHPKLKSAEDVEVEWEGEQPSLKWGWYRPQHKRNPKGLLTQWRTTPMMFDWNGDGLMDLVMLDHEGYLAYFERTRHGDRLALLPPKRIFANESGDLLRMNAASRGHSGRSKFTLADWNNDGRVDLILNSRNAAVRLNLGERDGKIVFADPQDLSDRELSQHTTSPTTVDFDNDGRPELLLGAEDGYFYYYHPRNARSASRGRTVTCLSGDGWQLDGEPVRVPHTWNAVDAADGPGGSVTDDKDSAASTNSYLRKVATYRRSLPCSRPGRRLFLKFDGASISASVSINGRAVGRHVGAFTAFTFEVTDYLRTDSESELIVEVDNRLGELTQPMSADFSVFGGLYRDVWLIETPMTCIDPTRGGPGVRIDANPQTGEVVAYISVLGGTNEVHRFKESGFELWSPEHPKLYARKFSVKQNGCFDEVSVRYAFRNFEFRADGFYLNGKRRQLRGVNRHQDREGFGWALSPDDETEDIRLIKGMGADALRTAHYPQSQHVYDLCDELGLICWVEYPNVNRVVFNDAFEEGMRRQIGEMVVQLYNHPSIAMWSIANELDILEWGWHLDQGETIKMLSRTRDLVRRLDPARPVVMASQYVEPEAKPVLDVVDQLAFNRYPGWYYGGTMRAVLDEMFAGSGRSILGMSEYGVGGSVLQHDDPSYIDSQCAGNRKFAGGEWHPEEYQAFRMHDNLRTLTGDPRVWGHFVWAMFDFASDLRTEGHRKGINDKGIMTYDHKVKKDVYFLYEANWTTNRVLHLVGTRMKESRRRRVSVMGISNVGAVTLKVNGKVIGIRDPDEACGVFWRDVELQEGDNHIELASESCRSAAVWRFCGE